MSDFLGNLNLRMVSLFCCQCCQSVNDSASDNTSEESDNDSESDYEDDNDKLIPASDSSLHNAASDGDCDTCLALIEEGVNVNSIYGDDNDTPLILASRNGRLDVVKLLLDNGAVMECKTSRIGFTIHSPHSCSTARSSSSSEAAP